MSLDFNYFVIIYFANSINCYICHFVFNFFVSYFLRYRDRVIIKNITLSNVSERIGVIIIHDLHLYLYNIYLYSPRLPLTFKSIFFV